MRFNAVPVCPICGSAGSVLYAGLPDRLFGVQGQFGFKKCRACGLLWIDPRPAESDLPKCYTEYYTHRAAPEHISATAGFRPLGGLRDAFREAILCGRYGYKHLHTNHGICRLGPALSFIPLLDRRAKYDLAERLPVFIPGGIIVDVGCGNGVYLNKMKSLGWRVYGVEPDSAASEPAIRSGLDVFRGVLKDAPIKNDSSDQVTMIHVLEHLPNPLEDLSECLRILKKGGRMVIYTPNAESLAHGHFGRNFFALDPPRHLNIFTARSIRKILRDAGFTRMSVRTTPYSAPGIYDASAAISSDGKITDLDAIKRRRCRRIFGAIESAMCRFGLNVGEEIEAVAFK